MVLVIGIFAACTTEPSTTPVDETSQVTIVSIGPNVTEILLALDPGISQRLVAMDNMSVDVPGVPEGIPLLDMFAIDVETILMLEPTIVIASDMIQMGGDPLALVSQAGTQVVYIPMADSLEGIMDSFHHIATAAGLGDLGGYNLFNEMAYEIEKVRAIAATITERRTVYFEIGSVPSLFSFGEGTFLHEIVEIIGAINIFAGYGTWVSVAEEQILARNPDVILTNEQWVEDPIGEIKSRPGWGSLDAVINNRVHLIDANASSRPSHNVVAAMWEIARAVYPEYFE